MLIKRDFAANDPDHDPASTTTVSAASARSSMPGPGRAGGNANPVGLGHEAARVQRVVQVLRAIEGARRVDARPGEGMHRGGQRQVGIAEAGAEQKHAVTWAISMICCVCHIPAERPIFSVSPSIMSQARRCCRTCAEITPSSMTMGSAPCRRNA